MFLFQKSRMSWNVGKVYFRGQKFAESSNLLFCGTIPDIISTSETATLFWDSGQFWKLNKFNRHISTYSQLVFSRVRFIGSWQTYAVAYSVR